MKPQTLHFKLAQILTHTMKALLHADELKNKTKKPNPNPIPKILYTKHNESTKILSCNENILNHANKKNDNTLDTMKERETEVRSENNSQQFRSHEKSSDVTLEIHILFNHGRGVAHKNQCRCSSAGS